MSKRRIARQSCAWLFLESFYETCVDDVVYGVGKDAVCVRQG